MQEKSERENSGDTKEQVFAPSLQTSCVSISLVFRWYFAGISLE